MKRLLVGLFLLAIALVLLDRWVDARVQRLQVAASTFHTLSTAETERVRSIRVRSPTGGIDWHYQRLDGFWRYPAYHHAFVLPAAIDRLLRALLQSSATVVATDAGRHAHFGLGPRSFRIHLQDVDAVSLLDIHFGRGAPGQSSPESYVRHTDSDTVYHLHANPLLTLARGTPPMLDPQILPKALERRSVVRLRFTHDGRTRSLHRVEAGERPMPGRPPGRTFAWVMGPDAKGDTVLNENAYALVGYIQRLKYAALHDPRQSSTQFAGEVHELELMDEEGVIDLLTVGASAGDATYLRHETTGQVFTLGSNKVALMFPDAAALTDTLPNPSPYQTTEPFGM